MIKKPKDKSELRQDLVTGEWVVIAISRGKRPHAFAVSKKEKKQPISECPFEENFNNEREPVLRYLYEGKKDKKDSRDWSVVSIENKFPIVVDGKSKNCSETFRNGPYTSAPAFGMHEIIITRDHKKYIPDLSTVEMLNLVKAYRERFNKMAISNCAEYVLVFHNHGALAGASLNHPHSQMMTLPIIPDHMLLSLRGSEKYFMKHERCPHCDIVTYELEVKERVVYENKKFVVLSPFAPKIAFELRVFPKFHQSNFGGVDDDSLPFFADALQKAIAKLRDGLNDPAYNFFIHTTPVNQIHDHYHWHVEIMPKTSIWGGVEIGVGVEVSAITPEEATKYLNSL